MMGQQQQQHDHSDIMIINDILYNRSSSSCSSSSRSRNESSSSQTRRRKITTSSTTSFSVLFVLFVIISTITFVSAFTTMTTKATTTRSTNTLSTATAMNAINKKDDNDVNDKKSSSGADGTTTSNRRPFRFNKRKRQETFDDATLSYDSRVVPALDRHPARKVCLMIEPTPFTHVSGYANRFKEMLKYMSKAGDDVEILTVDSKTPAADLPTSYMNYPIKHTAGFTFPLYNHISLTIDLPEMKGITILESNKPDLIHVTSPGFLLFAAMFYARIYKIPLVMSYHTHLPTYGTYHNIIFIYIGLFFIYLLVFINSDTSYFSAYIR